MKIATQRHAPEAATAAPLAGAPLVRVPLGPILDLRGL